MKIHAPRPSTRTTFTLVALAAVVGGCKLQQTHGTRASGQSRLMDDTFAGKNACNPENHERPFVIEWDATDMSSFESHAASDVVFVRYEGCTLKVLDECKNDSIRGEQGAYKPVEWTTGQLETMDIRNEGELYAKLPLGKATLGARVQGGESFHMEYYVAGTRYATRDAVYAADLEGRYGCDGVTHFVYAYNLGAFALGSMNNLDVEAGGSVYGFGAGGSRRSSRQADKRGGDLAACRSDSATEIAGCKAPIRLTLRKIRPGKSPEAEALAAPDTPDSMSAAAAVATKLEMSDEARARWEAAQAKMRAGDGKGCLEELGAHDRLNPKYKSTDPSSPVALTRSFCVMLSGKCDAGKVQARKALEKAGQTQGQGPEQTDRVVEAYVGMYCRGRMGNRDALIQAWMELNKGANLTKKDAAFCRGHAGTVSRLMNKVKPRDEDDLVKRIPNTFYVTGAACFARAGDCADAFAHYKKWYPPEAAALLKDTKPEQRAAILKGSFESVVRRCKGKL